MYKKIIVASLVSIVSTVAMAQMSQDDVLRDIYGTRGFGSSGVSRGPVSNNEFNGTSALSAGVMGGLAGEVYPMLVNNPRFDASASVDDILLNSRTPTQGMVTIFQEPSAANIRAQMIDRQNWMISNNETEVMVREFYGQNGRRAQNKDAEARARVSRMENRIKEIEQMTDEQIIAQSNGRYPSRTYAYKSKQELASLIKGQSEKVAGVNILSGVRGMRALRNGAIVGGITYGILSVTNPASASEIAEEGDLEFVSTSSSK